MKNRFFIFFLFIFLLIFSGNILMAQQNQSQSQLGHFQVLFPALISAGFITSYLTLDLLYNLDYSEALTYDVIDVMLFFAVLPMYFHNLPLGLIFTGVSLGLYFASEYLWNIDEDFIAQIPANGYLDFSFFSTYAIYREGRKKAKSGIYDDKWREKAFGNTGFLSYFPYTKVGEWKPCSFFELAISPISMDNISDFLIFTIIPAGILAPFLQEGLYGNDFQDSVFTTGKSFIGTHELPIYLGIPVAAAFLYILCSFVAIGEEALFRGFLYEEFGSTINEWVGKVADMIIFPLFHVPGEIEYYQDHPEYFFSYFLRRALLTFIIDLSYDRGGLSRSVAFHFWVDFTQLFAYYLINGGVPQQSFMDIVGLGYKRIEIQFVVSF